MSDRSPRTCTQLLQEMVRLNSINASVSGKAQAERPLAEYLNEVAGSFDLMARRLPVQGRGFNLLVEHRSRADEPWLLFESHLDTVGVGGMTIDPFAGVVGSGRLYGRGACDTKGSGAAMLWALRDYARTDGPNNVAVLFTVDEEVSKAGIKTFVAEHLPALGWRPVGAIVGEPTMLRPIVAHNGVVRWAMHTHGVAAHSSDPSRGRSAISMMVNVITTLESRYIPSLSASHPLTGQARCSINLIEGGTQVNIVPDHCRISIDRRIVPGEDPKAIIPAIQCVLDDLLSDTPDLIITQDEPFIDPPLDPSGHDAFLRFAQQSLEQSDLPATPCGAGYGTDASDLACAGIPAVVLGPGDIAQAHTADEWIALDQLERASALYQTMMRQTYAR